MNFKKLTKMLILYTIHHEEAMSQSNQSTPFSHINARIPTPRLGSKRLAQLLSFSGSVSGPSTPLSLRLLATWRAAGSL